MHYCMRSVALVNIDSLKLLYPTPRSLFSTPLQSPILKITLKIYSYNWGLRAIVVYRQKIGGVQALRHNEAFVKKCVGRTQLLSDAIAEILCVFGRN